MTIVGEPVPAAPPPELRFRRRVNLRSDIAKLWRARLLMRVLAERELRARYKQSVLGWFWSLVGPVSLMIVFSVFVHRVTTVKTGDVPYALYSYIGLLPWTFFSGTLASGGTSLIANQSLLNKIQCPREVFPLSNILTNGVSTVIAMSVLLGLFVADWFAPKPDSVVAIVPLAVLLVYTAGTLLFVSAVMVPFRDVRHALPLAIQFALFATPIAYGMASIPRAWRGLYSAVDPLGPVIDGLRNTVLYNRMPEWNELGIAALSSLVTLYVGFVVFKRLEVGFADVA